MSHAMYMRKTKQQNKGARPDCLDLLNSVNYLNIIKRRIGI